MVRAVEIHAVPAADFASVYVKGEDAWNAYVGYKMLERMPPGHGFLGKPSVSSLASAHGAALSPPKFGPL
jgi:hypothetical protein